MKSDLRNKKKQRNLELLESRVVLSGTPTLIPINDDGSSFARDFVQVGDVAFFVANDGVSGRELWKTDGTVDGTSLVLDIHPGLASSDPDGLIEHNGLLYFAAEDDANGTELWRSDGTAAGTTIVRDIFPGEGYQVDQGDGPYSSLPDDIISANGRLFFSATDKDNGRELWMSDGTAAGTVLVKDIAAGDDSYNGETYPRSSSPTELLNAGGTIFFTADDGENGRELWRSNGTADGTMIVRDIKTGDDPYYYDGNYYGAYPASSNPSSLTLVEGQVFFTAVTDEAGRELWKTDGTESGTELVRDIHPGANSGFEGSEFDSLIEVDGMLFFAGINADGRELWISDGTSNGTMQVSNIGPGADNGLMGTSFVTVGNVLYFAADDGVTGEELWESDGTSSGTRLVHDLEIGGDGSNPTDLTVVDSRVFFVANTSENGVEVYESDGTASGTFLSGDLVPGPNSSFPQELGALDNTLLFSAATSNSSDGREVWSIDAEAERDDTATASLKILVDGVEVTVPASIGVSSAGAKLSQLHTDSEGRLRIESVAGEVIGSNTLGDFFQTWRTSAGAAGNNVNAAFSESQLLGNVASGRSTVQMFVNGQAETSFEDYVVQDGDDIVLVFAENAVVSINTNFGSLLFELFEEDTPQTVANFLNYVNDGDYDNTFFHRSIAGFVIQGGGFRTSSQTFTDTSQFTPITDDPAVQNEPGLENVRGTVAMAKIGGDPDSATNQFFVNLGDNRSNLDNQNGGFTVFARVLDMSVVETLEAVPTRDVDGGLYSDLAVTDDDQLVVIESIGGTGFVAGTRFEDANANGVRDAGESGLANEVVFIDDNNNNVLDPTEIRTVTDANGNFRLPTGAASDTAFLRYEQSGSKVLTTNADSYDLARSIGTATGNIFGEAEPDDTTAGDDNYTVTNNGTERRFDVLANDTGGNDAIPTLSSVTQGNHGGIVSIDGDEIVYEAMSGFSGVETFTYTIRNDMGVSDTASVTVTVNEPADSDDPNAGQISGYSFLDRDGDGGRSAGELGVPGAVIRLSGTSDSGQAVNQRVLTAEDGSYLFSNIPAGTYTVTQQQPMALHDGSDSSPASSATAGDDRISSIILTAGDNVTDNNFGESSVRSEYVNISWFFASSKSPQDSLRETMAIAEEINGNKSLAREIRDGTGTSPIDNGGDGNRSPVAVSDSYSVDINDELTVTAANGVLRNDTDPDADQLTAAVGQPPSNGTLDLDSDGSFTYTPDSEFSGTDTFTYTALDTSGSSSTATVTITVQGPPNTFRVSENAVTGDPVGTLTPDASLNGDIVYEFENSSAAEELKLLPDDHIEGGTDAAVVLIEYLDFQCPTCRTYHPIVEDLVSEFGNDLLVVTRHLPLEIPHPNAIPAAIAAEAAGRQGEFFGMGDLLFTNQDEWSGLSDPSSVFEGYADDLGLDLDIFRDDVADPDLRDRVTRDADNAAALGLNGTPSFFLNGEQLTDLPDDFDEFEMLIEDQLDDVDDVFALDRFTGELTVANGAALDFELRSTHILSINATDINGNTVPLTATINLIDENESTPIANSDSYSVDESQTLNTTSANGVLANDSDADGDDLTAVLVSDASNGTLVLEDDGSFSYTPDSGFIGSDEFSYHATDGEFTSDTVTVTITVRDVNLNPVAATDTYSTNENTPLNVSEASGVLANDSDPDGDTLTSVIVTQPSSGTLAFEADGSFAYTPNSGFTGTDSFTYRANDGELDSNIATVTVTVAGVNAVPVAVPDSYSTSQDTPLTTIASSGILANDSDADGDQIGAEIRSQPANGSLTVNADGSFVYTPDAGYFGEDSFTYVAVDGKSESAVATVTINVVEIIPNNNAPVAVGEVFGTPQDTVLNVDAAGGVLANDSDDDGDTLSAELVAQASNGTVNLAADGSFTYTPNADYVGTDSFTYRAKDDTESSETATVTINVTSLDSNAAPVGSDDSYSVSKNTPLTVAGSEGLLANDSDADGNVLMIEAVVAEPANGILVVDADGGFSYSPDADFVGTDSFTYRATDGTASSNDVVVTLTIEDTVNGNTAPVANEDQYETSEDIPLSVLSSNGVLANDTDADGDDLTATVIEMPANGTVDMNDAGAFAYTPNADFHGTDSFTYQVSDGNGGTGQATVTIVVESVNDGPIGVDDEYQINADLLLAVSEIDGILKNDSDVDGDQLTVELATDVANGTLALQANGAFDYAADNGFSGVDSFTYRVFDGTEFSPPVLVEIEVFGGNIAPTAEDDSFTVVVDSVLQVEAANGVLANDDDPNSDALTATLVAEPTNGTLTFNPDGSFVYTPNATFHGTDLFRYTVSDGELESDSALVAIFVNNAPVASDDTYFGLINEVLTIDLEDSILANDIDADGDNLSITVTTMPESGTLVMDDLDGTFEYTPDTDFSGTVSFTYHINDSFEDSNEATVTINIVSELPLTGTPDSYAIREEQMLAVPVEEGVLANDDADPSATVELVSDTTNGTLNLAADGSFEYTPNPDYFGEDTFTYKVLEQTVDGVRMSTDITVTIAVQDVNDSPVAFPDSYSLTDDIRLMVTAEEGVLVNDTDVDGNDLVASIVTDPSNGFVVMESDGSFIYMPRLGFIGTDTFTYTATDLRKTSEPAVVTIEVHSTATIITLPDSYSIREEMTLSVDAATGVLSNDMHVEGANLTAALVDGPANGTLQFNDDGSFEYISDVDFYGNDTFSYTATDGTSVSPVVLVNITVENVNDPPVGTADSYQAVIDSPLTTDVSTGVLANDLDDSVVLTAELIDGPSNGQLLFDADGTFTYQPNAGFVGEDFFTYKAKDQFLESEVTRATIVVSEPVNGDIATVADTYSIREELDLIVELDRGVLLNDSSSTGATLTASIATGPSHGTLAFNSDGTFVYTSDDDFFGEDSFTYTATDGVTTSAATIVTLNVQNTADNPVAVADTYMVGTDMLLTVPVETGVLANDIDVDGDDLTAMIVSNPTNGSLVFQPDGSFTYQPTAGFEGVDSFTYRARDRFIESTNATVTITVAEPGSIPTITTSAEEYTMREDRELTVDAAAGVLSNDTISNGAMLTATIVTQPANGTLILNADGSLSYTPNPEYAGIDTFGYIASSGTVSSAEQLSTIRVQAVNDAPMGVDDSYSATVDLPLIIAAPGVLANDTDVEGDSLTAAILTQPSNGLVIFNEDGSFTYQPSFAYTGDDSFTYIPNDLFSSDGEVDESRATTVTITVSPESSGSITTESDSYLLLEDQVHNESAETGVLANDMGDNLTVTIGSQPDNGNVELQADGSFTYTPNADFFGEDIFTYTASNGTETSTETEVHLHVQPANDRPIALADSYDVDSGATLTVNAVDGVLGNDLELDNEPLMALLIDDPTNGTLTLNEDGSLEYTPNASFTGIDTFTYIATDATRDSDVTTVTITVGTSPQYMAVDDLYQLREDGVLRIAANAGVLVNDVSSPVGNTVSVDSDPMFGSIILNADGSFEYTPQQDFTGDDTFTYTASAGGDEATATVTIRISNRPDAPVANDDSYMMGVGETLTTNPLNGILANDTDGDGDSLTAVPLTTPDSGILVVNGDGTFTYTPEDGFIGLVTFTYTARDDGGSVSNVATVTIQVGDPPAAATAIPSDSASDGLNGADLIDEAFADDEDLSGGLL